MKSILVVLGLTITLASALYSSSSPVQHLTKSNFNSDVIKSSGLWLVEFYAPWCGHCKSLVPEWEKAAKALKGIINVGAVDMTAEQDVGSPYNIQGFPTIKLFSNDKSSPIDYNGGRSADAIVQWVLEQAKQAVQSRLSGKSSSGKSSSGSQSSEKKGGSTGSDKDVVVLTNSNFDEMIIGSKELWLVEFYAPWCGHCKNLEPAYNEAATKLKGQAKLGKVDATVETSLGQRFGVQGYPTIKLFVPGQKDPLPYEGGRDASSIVNYMNQKLSELDIPPEIHELTSQSIYDDECKGSSTLCLITFLPHIYDSSAKQRNDYIEIIRKVATKQRTKQIKFLWAQAGDHLEVERSLNLGFGYPAVVAINQAKEKYVICKLGFEEAKLKEFIDGIYIGVETVSPLPKLPKFSKTDKWDGKDAQPEIEETYEIDEL